MERLLVLLEGSEIPVKITVTGAIGSAAHAAKEKFRPYFDQTIKRLLPFLSLTGSDEQSDLRGVATDTIGTLADAVGSVIFRPHFYDLMQAAFDALTMDNTRLRESSFICFGVMAQVFESDFAPYLPKCVPALVASCQQKEDQEDSLEDGGFCLAPSGLTLLDGGKPTTANDAANAFSTGAGSSKNVTVDEEDIEGEETDLEALEQMFSKVNSAVAIEKEVAADTIGELFAAVKEPFMPYVEETVQILIDLLDHYYEGIRKAAIGALFSFIKTIYEISDPTEWVPGGVVVSNTSIYWSFLM